MANAIPNIRAPQQTYVTTEGSLFPTRLKFSFANALLIASNTGWCTRVFDLCAMSDVLGPITGLTDIREFQVHLESFRKHQVFLF